MEIAQEQKVKEALRVIIDKAPNPIGFNTYAKTYAMEGLHMTNENELRVQILYVLNNLQYWCGDSAKEVKKVLRDYAGIK